jgi:hypothetical protein
MLAGQGLLFRTSNGGAERHPSIQFLRRKKLVLDRHVVLYGRDYCDDVAIARGIVDLLER